MKTALSVIAILALAACAPAGTDSGSSSGVYRSIGMFQRDYGGMFGLMFLATLPVLIFHLLLQKHFVKDRTGGAVKG